MAQRGRPASPAAALSAGIDATIVCGSVFDPGIGVEPGDALENRSATVLLVQFEIDDSGRGFES